MGNSEAYGKLGLAWKIIKRFRHERKIVRKRTQDTGRMISRLPARSEYCKYSLKTCMLVSFQVTLVLSCSRTLFWLKHLVILDSKLLSDLISGSSSWKKRESYIHMLIFTGISCFHLIYCHIVVLNWEWVMETGFFSPHFFFQSLSGRDRNWCSRKTYSTASVICCLHQSPVTLPETFVRWSSCSRPDSLHQWQRQQT